jgi:hypothetical protein
MKSGWVVHLKTHTNFSSLSVDQKGNADADYEYHARQLIRAIFAFIEGLTFTIKVKAAELCIDNGRNISFAERFFATDTDHMLTEKGESIDRPAHIRLSDNVRSAFALQEKALGLDERFDASVEWWSCSKSSTKVCDRLTHPKLPEDVDVSGSKIVDALKAYEGFNRQLMFYFEQRSA